VYFFDSEEGIAGLLLFFYEFFVNSWWGPALFVIVASLRPVLLLPAALFNLLAGVLFGFWFGLLYILLSAVASATIVYLFGRYTTHIPSLHTKRTIATENFLQNSPFLSVVAGHMFFLPFDVVNYGAGFLKIPYTTFITSMLTGSLFGLLTFVGVGASLDVATIRENGVSLAIIDYRILLLSIFLFICFCILSLLVKGRGLPTKLFHRS
jgi:uncharacterized membrane protein YdjX (TVP38/TMEM64 family)